MNRREFFGAFGGFVASTLTLPKWLKADASFSEGSGRFVDDYWNPPIVYKGDKSDPNYSIVGDGGREQRKGLRLYVNGEDRTREAYECYAGEAGWVNIYVRYRCGVERWRTVRIGDGPNNLRRLRASIRGKVEWRRVVTVKTLVEESDISPDGMSSRSQLVEREMELTLQ